MCCNSEIDVFCKVSLVIVIVLIITLIFVNIFFYNMQDRNVLVAIARPGDNNEIGNATIKFSINDIVIGNSLSHSLGSDEILINETGVYQISYQLYGIDQTTGTFNFNAVLIVNNIALEDTLNESPVLKENIRNNRMTLTSTVILRLNAGDILSLGGASLEDIIYERARIDIEKID